MAIYTDPPEWEAKGKKPPSSKRTEGWRPGDRVPASWLNWFWFSTVNSLREIAQAFVNHRDASAPHDGHETKEGVTAKVEEHSQKTTAVHGVGQQYVAKTSRSDQWPSWNDIPDKPSTFPVDAATLPQASTSQAGIVQLTNSRSSTSETLAVTAKALNDHRTSADHDGRYYTKTQVDSLIQTTPATRFQVSGNVHQISVPGNSHEFVQFLEIIVPAGKRLVLKRARYYLGSASMFRLRVANTFTLPPRTWDSPSPRGDSEPNAVIIDNSGGDASVTDRLRVMIVNTIPNTVSSGAFGWWLDLSIE